jgi:release factor glutamine methyltransferase
MPNGCRAWKSDEPGGRSTDRIPDGVSSTCGTSERRASTVTIAETITRAAARLAAHRIENSRLDAEVLLSHILGRDRAWLLAHYPDELDFRSERSYDLVLDRRAVREPLQYITGSQEFWGLPFWVTPDVLIPRPETELVVETALALLQNVAEPTLIDLCTGSGCIAVSLAQDRPQARVFAVDRSEAALSIARENARRNRAAQIRFLAGDLFAPLEELDLAGRADIITANPPYVRSGELATLQPEVRDFEPEMALIAGPRGTEISELIISGAPAYLRPGGSLIMEMGIGQAEELRNLAADAGSYSAVNILKDLSGIERVVAAKKR